MTDATEKRSKQTGTDGRQGFESSSIPLHFLKDYTGRIKFSFIFFLKCSALVHSATVPLLSFSSMNTIHYILSFSKCFGSKLLYDPALPNYAKYVVVAVKVILRSLSCNGDSVG